MRIFRCEIPVAVMMHHNAGMPTSPETDTSQYSAGRAPIETIGIGMLGQAFMGKAHSHAYLLIPRMMWPPPAVPRLVSICGRNLPALEQARQRYGYRRLYTDWKNLVDDPDIQVFDNVAPNDLHAEPCIAAARAGKHVLCEKPLARSADEAWRMLDAVVSCGVQHMVAHNYRFVPALCLARDLIAGGRLGEIRQFRGLYLKESAVHTDRPITWRMQGERAGSGALGDLGSHTIDLARWLVGEIGAVHTVNKTFVPHRPGVDGTPQQVTVDDASISLLEFQSGAIGTIEATRMATGCMNQHRIEIYGSIASVVFDLERLNELHWYSRDDPPDVQGFHHVLVTEHHHPYYRFWWPPGHTIGWEHTVVHEIYHFLTAIVDDSSIAPRGATFLDGYRNAVVTDAILDSARTGKRQYPTYRA